MTLKRMNLTDGAHVDQFGGWLWMTSDLGVQDIELENLEPSSLLAQEYAMALMRVIL